MSNKVVADDEHLADVEDGAGCTEIWEKLSAQRAAADVDEE
ncbi:hypothetical protein SAMN05192561_101674 [Halopenitus malekzadehii]|uniref:Uncharacterized protein n=1 Tax=Halopenitus malekzadehii TaxID=1267564 RepID=A0A1H6I2J5_9EURY|nr:hypothetical protein [Halopenitus malekzadehii]SEH40681.1 hypothetical protein SAMN05192561_101674 [Halopenitus malekzadehii]